MKLYIKITEEDFKKFPYLKKFFPETYEKLKNKQKETPLLSHESDRGAKREV